MSNTTPLVDERTAAQLRDAVSADLAANLAQYVPPEFVAEDQATAALISVVARLGEIVIERLNQAPNNNLLAFLDLLGTAPLPPVPARVPLTFTVNAGSATDAVVPAGTQVAAPAAEGEKNPVVFETERELTAVAATLQTLVAVDADRDLLADHSALLAAAAPNGVHVFAGDQLNTHVFYIGSSAYLSNARLTGVTLKFDMSNTSPTAGDATDARALLWEVWDGVNGVTLTASDATQDLRVGGEVSFASLAPVAVQTVNGVNSRWLRCRLLTPISPNTTPAQSMVRAGQLPVLANVQIRAALGAQLLAPDFAFANGQAVDVSVAFLPFGDRPKIGDAFYIGSRDALGQPGGLVTVNITLVNPVPNGTHTVPSDNLQLKWETWDGSKWALLGTTTQTTATPNGSNGFTDSGKAFTKNGTAGDKALVTFTLPTSLAPTTVNGVESNWIRVQIVAGDYGVDATYVLNATAPGGFEFHPPTFRPPMVSASDGVTPGALGLSLTYTATAPYAAPDAVVAFNNGQFKDLTSALAADNAVPFVGFPAQPPAYYAAFTLPPARKSFPNRPVSLYHGVRLPPYGENPTPLFPELSVQPTPTSPPVTPGSTVVHHFTLINTSTDAVDCTLTTLGGAWTSFVDSHPVHLSPGNSTDIQVSVTVPPSNQLPGANASDRGFLMLSLSSDSEVHSVAFETRVGDVAPQRRELRFEYWNGTGWAKLVADDGTELLEHPGVVEFLGPPDFVPSQQFGANGYWIRALFEAGDDPPVQLRTMLLNTTFAAQTVTLRNEVLGSSDASVNQRFRTTRSPVLAGPQLEVREPGQPSPDELAALGAPGVTVVTPTAGPSSDVWVRWLEVTDFHGSGPQDRHYVLDHLAGEVRFGDGVQGRIPPRGVGNIRFARYQTGGGEAGNRAPGTIVQLKTTVPYVERVVNLEPAEGGFGAESNASLLVRAPRTLRHGGRAVAREDFEDLALAASPGVARARAVPLRQLRDDPLGTLPVLGAASVIIVPQSTDAKPLPSVGLIAQVEDNLRALSTPTASVAVVGPIYVRVDVSVEVALVSIEGANQVEDAVAETLRRFLHPLTGGRDGAGWDFGRQPQISDLYAVISDVPGVDHIRHLSANLVEDLAGALGTGRFLVFSGDHQIALTFVGAE